MVISDLNHFDDMARPYLVGGNYSYYSYDDSNTGINELDLTLSAAFFGSSATAIANSQYNYTATQANGLGIVTPKRSFAMVSGYAAIQPIW